jgi:hypothetical protein
MEVKPILQATVALGQCQFRNILSRSFSPELKVSTDHRQFS